MYRYEKSGVVHGLTRARGFTQDDAHIYCTQEQMADELDSLLTFVLDLLRDYGLNDFYLELSTKDPEKFVGSDEVWEEATETLRQVAEKSGPRAGARPGRRGVLRPEDLRAGPGRDRPHLADVDHPARLQPAASGSSWSTQAADGTRQRPVMIHRALFGSIERFFAVLLEHYAGAFPPWLAPVQVVGIPVADAHVPYLQEFAARLRSRGHPGRGGRLATTGCRRRSATRQQQKVPFMLIAGDEDVERRARCPSATATARRTTACRGPGATRSTRIVGAVRGRRAVPTPGSARAERSEVGSTAALPGDGDADGVASGRSSRRRREPDAFERLWTPHRMAYIQGENKPTARAGDDCPFCRVPAESDEDGLIVARGELGRTRCSTCTRTTPAT